LEAISAPDYRRPSPPVVRIEVVCVAPTVKNAAVALPAPRMIWMHPTWFVGCTQMPFVVTAALEVERVPSPIHTVAVLKFCTRMAGSVWALVEKVTVAPAVLTEVTALSEYWMNA
jgi:hypothetical protein